MATRIATQHTHKYGRIFQGMKKRPIMACHLPDCSHYRPFEEAVNKASLCWDCGDTFVLTKLDLLKKPRCPKCSPRRQEFRAPAVVKAAQSLDVDKLLEQFAVNKGGK